LPKTSATSPVRRPSPPVPPRIARPQRRHRQFAAPRRHRHGQHRAAQGPPAGIHHLGLHQHVGGAGRHGIGLGIGKDLGIDQHQARQPMVFIARAAAPMLPGWLGCERTTRMRSRMAGSGNGVVFILCPGPSGPGRYPGIELRPSRAQNAPAFGLPRRKIHASHAEHSHKSRPSRRPDHQPRQPRRRQAQGRRQAAKRLSRRSTAPQKPPSSMSCARRIRPMEF
jgi:hypothetical protein